MAEVIAVNGDELVLQVRVKLDGSMLNMEEAIQSAVNEVGSLATAEALKRFDTTGAPIQIGHVRMTSKGKVRKCYETPYGAVQLERYVYQTSSGGKTYCPLDERARTIISSTPRFAKQVSSKYSQLSLKHEPQAASQLLGEMNNMLSNRQKQGLIDKLKSAITYFRNQRQRMDYNFYQMNNLPIGSGVTEAACKTLIKQRLCQSGMKWKNQGISMVLHLRALISTKGRWEQFWERINQAGLIGLAEIC